MEEFSRQLTVICSVYFILGCLVGYILPRFKGK